MSDREQEWTRILAEALAEEGATPTAAEEYATALLPAVARIVHDELEAARR
jgi:hypothetical protein